MMYYHFRDVTKMLYDSKVLQNRSKNKGREKIIPEKFD